MSAVIILIAAARSGGWCRGFSPLEMVCNEGRDGNHLQRFSENVGISEFRLEKLGNSGSGNT
jgi:hypothetical protein